jgi:hypothetical protein
MLRKELESARERQRAAELDVARLEAALAALEAPPEQLSALRQNERQMVGMGILEASRILVKEKGPQKTGDLMRAAMARGLTTTSTKPVSAFYSTLAGSKDFERIDGKWHLVSERL